MDKNPDWMQHPELDGESFYLAGNQTGFLLIHGFTATTTEVRPLATFLRSQGFTVSAPLLPGHGTRPDILNKTKMLDWINCLDDAYQKLQLSCRVIFIGGESMGGLLSLYMADKHPEISGILLYAPALKIKDFSRAKLLSYFKDFHWKRRGDESMPWKGYRVVPLKATRHLSRLQRVVYRLLPRIHQPVLICQGIKDLSLDTKGAAILINRIGSKDKTLLWFSESQHCILLDREFPKVSEVSLGFINRILEQKSVDEVSL